MGNQVKQSFIILISFLLLSPFLTSCEKYVGEYKDGKRNGQGTYTFPDGRKFVGEWKDGKINGQGTMTTLDGTKYEGEWKDEKPWNGIYYDKNENIIGKFVNGERIKQ